MRGRTIRRSDGPARLQREVATILVEARGDRTRAALASAAGVRPNTLGDIETGRANPTLAYLEDLEAVYGIEFVITTRDRCP